MIEFNQHAAVYPGIYLARSTADAATHQRMIAAVRAAVAKSPPERDGKGGKKVRVKEVWELPEFQSLKAAARQLFHHRFGDYSVQIADHWVNVMESGEWSELHVHSHTAAAVVYMLESGDANAGGDFALLDRELPFCCDDQRYPTHDVHSPSVEIRPTGFGNGSALIFPAHLQHHVTCYRGRPEHPRLTVAMNLVSPAVTAKQLLQQEFEKARAHFKSGQLGRLTPFA